MINYYQKDRDLRNFTLRIALIILTALTVAVLADCRVYLEQTNTGLYLPNHISIEVKNSTTHKIGSNIQAAIDAANPGDILELDPGEYNENVHIQKNLTIIGAGIGKTIIKAQKGSAFIIGDETNQSLDLLIANVTIKGGSGTLISEWGGDYTIGGGILNYGKLTITNTELSNNQAELGGGIFNFNGELNLDKGSSIKDNIAAQQGGGIYNYLGTMKTSTGSSISNNKADIGGGIYSSGKIDLASCFIDHNIANQNGGGIYSMSMIIMNNCNVFNNSASHVGGGIYNDGEVTIQGSYISNNSAYYGAGIYTWKTVTVNNGFISSNTGKQGSGIYVDGIVNIYGGTIDYNIADNKAGGLYIDGKGEANMYGGSISHNIANIGGGVYNDGVVTLKSGSIANNKAGYGGGMYNWGTANLDGGSISQNTASDYGGGIYSDYGGNSTININGCFINYNEAKTHGGGIYNNGGLVALNKGSISNNIANDGGGIYNFDGNLVGNLSIVRDNFPNNII